VDGDNLLHRKDELLKRIKDGEFAHLDKANADVQLADNSAAFIEDPSNMPVICMNAYMGYRAIKRGLDEGADIVICGRSGANLDKYAGLALTNYIQGCRRFTSYWSCCVVAPVGRR
jgi:hypothetical protein